jgi:hypothetical protein
LAQKHHIFVTAASFWFKMAKRTKSEIKKMSIRKAFTLFCKATSLHGWSYLSQEKMNKIWQMFLAAFLLVIIIISTGLIWTNTNQVSSQMMGGGEGEEGGRHLMYPLKRLQKVGH